LLLLWFARAAAPVMAFSSNAPVLVMAVGLVVDYIVHIVHYYKYQASH